MPQQRKYTIIMVLYENKRRIGQSEGGNYRGISLVAHVGKILLKIIARCLSEYCEHVEVLPEDQSAGSEWFPTESFYHKHYVCDSLAT